MADETTSADKLISAPIIPGLPQIENSVDPLANLKAPAPIVTPLIPSGIPQNLPTNIQLQGDFEQGPNPGAKPANILKNGTLDYVKAVTNAISDKDWAKDRFKYGRTYSYGSGYKNMNFERYYNHPRFSQLGFSPYRDNDTYYNEKSSWFDDFNRMRGEWLGLTWAGFKSVWGSEIAANEAMEKGMAIGQSSRGGAGAWVTNFGLNTAYTTGIMAEMGLENLALAGVEVASFGTATPEVAAVGAARNAVIFSRLTKAWNATSKMINTLKTAETAREFWNASKVGSKAVDFAKWLNPLGETTDFVTHIAKGSGGLQNLSNLAKISKGFGSFYKDVRELNLAFSEANLEGEGAASQYQQRLLDDYYNEHGVVAEGQAAQDIYNRAQALKGTVALANDLTIYYTNKLVFEDMFKGIKPGKKIAASFLEGSGKAMKTAEAATYKVGQNIVEAGTKTTGKKVADFLLKSKHLPWSKQYFVGNLGEGLQESLQEAISSGSMDYYDRIHKDPLQAGFYSGLASIGKGLNEQFSAQGLDTFLSGYLMGSLIQGAQGAAGKAYDVTKSKIVGEKSEAAQAREAAEKTDNDVMAAANHVGKNALIYGDHNVNMATAMKQANEERTKSDERGDVKTSQDLSDELKIDYMQLLARTGNTGLVTEHVDDMLGLDDKSLAEAYNLSEDQAPDVRKKLQTLKDRVEGYQRKYDKAQEVFANPFNPWMYNQQKHPEAFQREFENYIAHDRAVANILFATESHALIAERMSKIGRNLSGTGDVLQNLVNVIKGGTPVANAAGSEVSLLIDHIQRRETVAGLRSQLSVLDKGTPEQKREAEKIKKQLELLKDWNKAADHYAREYARNKKLSKPTAQDEKDLDSAITMMYDVYDKYLRHVAKTKRGYVFDKQLQEAFSQIKDYIALDHDSAGMVNTINVLSDPTYFERYRDIEASVIRMQQEQRLAKLQEALDSFKNITKTNSFLKELFDLGVFVLPEDVDKLKTFAMVDFYSTATKAIVPYNSDLYKKLLAIVEKYSGLEGGTVTEKPIPEAGTSEEAKKAAKYSSASRPKLENDKRTYADHAKQFGFDPKSSSSTVSTETILKSIVNSEFSTAEEKALARRLLTTVDPLSKITFVNNLATPGHYNSKDKSIVVDARYSSADYSLGIKGHPIEFVILHEYGHALTVEALNTDAQFKAQITKLNDLAKQYQATKEFKDEFGYKPLYGTMNEAEFVTEALNNPTFQRMLEKIPYEVSGKPSTAWEGFMNALAELFTKLLGVENRANVLNEALYVITAKIDTGAAPAQTKAAPSSGPTTLTLTEKIKTTTPIELMKVHVPDLLQELVKGYRQYSVDQLEKEVTDSYDDVIISDGFKRFITESGTAADIITAYNEDPKNGRTGTVGPIAKTKVTPRATNRWAPGNKWLFTGKTQSVDEAKENIVDTPIEILSENKYFDNDKQEDVHEIQVKDLNDGSIFFIDLLEQDPSKTPIKDIPRDMTFGEREVPGGEIKVQDSYKGVPIISTSGIKNAEGEAGAAQHKDGTILLDRALLRQKYDQKAWTKSRTLSDKSKSTPLDETLFPTYEDFETFVIEHEYQHTLLDRGKFLAANPKSTKGQYEDEINRRALTELGMLKTQEEKDEENLIDNYDKITTKEELDKWKNTALGALGSRIIKDLLSEKTGETFDSDYIRKKIDEKEKELAISLKFENLKPGVVVLMQDGKTVKVVTKNDGKNVTLVSVEDYKLGNPDPGKVVIAKGVIKENIKMKNSDFIDKAEPVPQRTDEEIAESNKAAEAAKADDVAKAADALKKASDSPVEGDDWIDEINACNT